MLLNRNQPNRAGGGGTLSCRAASSTSSSQSMLSMSYSPDVSSLTFPFTLGAFAAAFAAFAGWPPAATGASSGCWLGVPEAAAASLAASGWQSGQWLQSP